MLRLKWYQVLRTYPVLIKGLWGFEGLRRWELGRSELRQPENATQGESVQVCAAKAPGRSLFCDVLSFLNLSPPKISTRELHSAPGVISKDVINKFFLEFLMFRKLEIASYLSQVMGTHHGYDLTCSHSQSHIKFVSPGRESVSHWTVSCLLIYLY